MQKLPRESCGSQKLSELTTTRVCMAPMVGLSNVVLRSLVRSYMNPETKTIWPTEMLNSRRLPSQRLGQTPETLKHPEEDNIVPQILGNEERFISESVKKLRPWGAVGIDINMGCPVKKALRHNYGVALMGDIDYAAEVVRMTKRSTLLPVSVKIRAGKNGDKDFLLKFTRSLVDAGVDWLTLHPRTPEQKRRGKSDWTQIKLLKDTYDIPIIGNGDIQTIEDVDRMLELTDCDMVMIGRALTAKPWLLAEYSQRLNNDQKGFDIPSNPEEEAYEYGRSMKKALGLFQSYYGESGIKKFSFLIRASHMWLNFGHNLYAKLIHLNSFEQAEENLESFFKKSGLRMMKETELRY